MVLSEKEVTDIRDALSRSKNPLFIYDDDPDGLCSFLLLYRFFKKGKGRILKTTSTLTEDWVRLVDESHADCVVILDVPVVTQGFLDKMSVPVFWLDHHTPVDCSGVHYYNPRLNDPHAYFPTTRLSYDVVAENGVVKDSWIALVGCVADWHVPDFKDAFVAQYPDLFSSSVSEPEVALFGTPVGKLARIFSFILKGKTSEAFSCIKILTRVESPYDILYGTTSQGRFIFKRFEHVNEKYVALLEQALAKPSRSMFFVFRYAEDQWSFSSELSNELAYRFPRKVILVCREKNGSYKCSIRSRDKPILPVLQKVLPEVGGSGGGHEYACGAVVPSDNFEVFLKRFKKEYG